MATFAAAQVGVLLGKLWVKLRGLPNSLLAYAEHLRTPITLLVVPNTLHSTRATAFQVAAFGAHLQVLLGAAHVAQPPADGLEWAEELVDLLKRKTRHLSL